MVAKRGGLNPRIRRANSWSTGSSAAIAANRDRSTVKPKSLSNALRASASALIDDFAGKRDR
jgi:hypothetical protein